MIIREEEERVKTTIVRSEPVVNYAEVQSYRGDVAKRKFNQEERRQTRISPLNVEYPEEILVEILARLPPKPLLRFSCVSKQWQSIVWDPKFARNYLKLGSSRGMLYPYIEYTPHRPDMGFSGWSGKKLFIPDHHRHCVLFYFTTTSRPNDRRILAASNGLVLSQIHPSDFNCFEATRPFHNIRLCVSNPLTRQHAILHQASAPDCLDPAGVQIIRPWTCGFATRATAGINGSYNVSYKAVLVLPPAESILDPAKHSSIQIFSSDAGRWERVGGPIDVPPAVLGNGYKAQDFCYKGILHWLDRKGGTRRSIVTYDPYKSPERFGHIRMPHGGHNILSGSLMSLVHSGHEEDFPRCCEIERCPGDTSLSLVVWQMADYDKQLWRLEQRCAISPGSLQLLGGCRQLISPIPGVFCYLFVRYSMELYRVVAAIDLRSGKEEYAGIRNMVRGSRHYPPCQAGATLPLVPFVLCPWSSPLYPNSKCSRPVRIPFE